MLLYYECGLKPLVSCGLFQRRIRSKWKKSPAAWGKSQYWLAAHCPEKTLPSVMEKRCSWLVLGTVFLWNLEPLQEEEKSAAGSLIVCLLWKRSDVLNPDQCPNIYELELKRSVTCGNRKAFSQVVLKRGPVCAPTHSGPSVKVIAVKQVSLSSLDVLTPPHIRPAGVSNTQSFSCSLVNRLEELKKKKWRNGNKWPRVCENEAFPSRPAERAGGRFGDVILSVVVQICPV